MQLTTPWDPYFGAPADWLSLPDLVEFSNVVQRTSGVKILQALLLIRAELRSPYRYGSHHSALDVAGILCLSGGFLPRNSHLYLFASISCSPLNGLSSRLVEVTSRVFW